METVKDCSASGDVGVISFCKKKAGKYHKMFQRTAFYEDFLCLGRYIISDPILRAISIGVLLTFLTPLLLFLIFVINVTFTFIGIVLLQVSALVIGIGILGFILSCTAISLGIIGLCIYCIFRSTSNFLNSVLFNRD